MFSAEEVRPWIRQSEVDAEAAQVDDAALLCHRRYWFQQSYEKAIKAYAMMRWAGNAADEPQFRRLFLLQHGPLTRLARTDDPLSKALHLLARDAEAFIRKLPDSDTLLKLDRSAPSTDSAAVSYRYPFEYLGVSIAPADFAAWDEYQGSESQVRSATSALLKAVKQEFAVFSRKPK